MQPTGLLQLSIEPRLHPTLRQSWIDATDQPLEEQLPEIAAVFIGAAPILQERRRLYEENEWRRHEEEMRRYEERQRQLLERNRLRGFLELASRWKEVETARLFLDALANRAAGDLNELIDDRTVGEWIVWARERLTAHDPLEARAAAVFQMIAAIDQWTYRGD
jgi:sirohydrochlorin ferrochelatase